MPAIVFPLEQVSGDRRVQIPFVPPSLGGTTSYPVTLSSVVALSGIPFIMAATGTVSNTGALVLNTAVANAYPAAYIYLPAGVAFAGAAAGWYYCVLSSTTAGTVYQTPYPAATNPAVGGLIQLPAAPVAAVGPGAFTGVTGAINGPAITIPGNLVSVQGVLRVRTLWTCNSSTNNKTVGLSLGGSAVASLVISGTPGNSGASIITDIYARGSQTAQVAASTVGGGAGVISGAQTYTSVNMAIAETLAMTFNNAAATDGSVLEAWSIELLATGPIPPD